MPRYCIVTKTSPGKTPPINSRNIPSTVTLSNFTPGYFYSTSNTIWSAQELQLLIHGLDMFPEEKYDNITRYLNIASLIPTKCTRDVASKIKCLSMQREISENNDNFYSHPQKRMRMERFLEGNESHHKETHLFALLQENTMMIHAMRNHLLQNHYDENHSIMLQFYYNCQTILDLLGTLSNSLPPLSLKLDTSLIADAIQRSACSESPGPMHAT